nr:RagB/SusD family nutrient uptake outer membrane protein [uncultured Carboxylicivirga sp.]
MKKILLYIGVCLAIINSSCSDFLDTPAKSSLDDEVIFSTYALAKGAIDNIKMGFTEKNSHRGRWIPYYGMNTDCDYWLGSSNLDQKADLMTYDPKTNNTEMNTDDNVWAMSYGSIEVANVCIRNLRLYSDLENDEGLRHLYGEALTLRAVYYGDLLKTFGDIPARFEPNTTETVYVPKSDRDIIYKQLITDLDEAADYVAWPGESQYTQSTTSVNKAFIKALRARLALNAGGYSQRPDGTVRKSTDAELATDKMMAIAKEECLDIIASPTVQLEDFESIFRNLALETKAVGGEVLWQIPMSETRGRFFYAFAIRHRSVDQHSNHSRGGWAGPTPNLYYDYDEKDMRRDVSVVPYEWGTAVNGFAQQELTSLTKWGFGKFRYEWMTRAIESNDSDDGINKIYIRYAEVILMAAEAVNEIDGPEAAKEYLRMLREKRFAPEDYANKVDDYLSAISNKEQMLKAIQDEHKFEFVGEMNRKEALIRWNILGSSLKETKQRITALRDRTTGSYGDATFDYSDVPEKLYYKYDADGESLIVYGLNRGEHTSPGDEYTSKTWIPNSSSESYATITDAINTLFVNDPDTKQFWPIWEYFIVNSNGSLTNDYGY